MSLNRGQQKGQSANKKGRTPIKGAGHRLGKAGRWLPGGGVRGVKTPSDFLSFACQFENSYGPAFSGTLNPPPLEFFLFCFCLSV